MQLNSLFYNLAPVLVIISFLSVPAFILLLWKGSVKLALAFLVFMIAESVLAALCAVYTFGGAFGPGMLMFCLSFLAVPLSLLILLLGRRPFFRVFAEDRQRCRFYLIGGLLIAALQLSPVVGHYAIRAICHAQNRRTGAQIIMTVETYKREHGSYPEDLSALVPKYMPALPSPGCSWLSSNEWAEDGFALQRCRSGEVLLTVRSVDRSSVERYNFETGNWSSVSFLDGACSYLR
jgi:hypothetical protein